VKGEGGRLPKGQTELTGDGRHGEVGVRGQATKGPNISSSSFLALFVWVGREATKSRERKLATSSKAGAKPDSFDFTQVQPQ
jgi:hypothetical protein